MSKLFINAKVILPDRIIDGAVRIDGEKITDVYENGYTKKESDELIDVGGLYLSPGFIDVHVHGGGGGYFMSGDEEEIDTVCKTHLRHGTTAFNPTLSAASKEMIINALAAMDSYDKRAEIRPDFLGYYLEGPYLSPNACGAMPEGHLRLPDPQEYDELLDRFANIVRWGLAPELDGALPLIEKLTRRGVISSVAHSDGYFDDVVKAREAGTNSITHLYSLTPTVRRKNAYRYSGVLEAAYLFDDLFVEVISDGCHLPESLLKLIYKIKGSDRIMIITDAISAAGSDQSDGVQYYSQTGSPIIVEDGVAKLPSREAFAGSIATMDRCVRTMMNLAEVPLWEAVKMASATPARHLGIFDRKGSIEKGKDADLVVFDSDVRVKSVYVRGKRVFN